MFYQYRIWTIWTNKRAPFSPSYSHDAVVVVVVAVVDVVTQPGVGLRVLLWSDLAGGWLLTARPVQKGPVGWDGNTRQLGWLWHQTIGHFPGFYVWRMLVEDNSNVDLRWRLFVKWHCGILWHWADQIPEYISVAGDGMDGINQPSRMGNFEQIVWWI